MRVLRERMDTHSELLDEVMLRQAGAELASAEMNQKEM